MATNQFAAGTRVDTSKSRDELEQLVRSHGAIAYLSGYRGTTAFVEFQFDDRTVRYTLDMPNPEDAAFRKTPTGKPRTVSAAREEYEQELRRRWRVFVLTIKGDLEAIRNGVKTFEQAFLPFFVMPNGQTMLEALQSISSSTDGVGRVVRDIVMPKALPEGSDADHD